jgi:uncharacterized protein YciI
MRFLFFYLMTDDLDRVRRVAPRHAAHWDQQAPHGYLGGPFADRSGGLITFHATTPDQARQLVTGDPFLREGLLSSWWLEQWLAEEAVPEQSTAGQPRAPQQGSRSSATRRWSPAPPAASATTPPEPSPAAGRASSSPAATVTPANRQPRP